MDGEIGARRRGVLTKWKLVDGRLVATKRAAETVGRRMGMAIVILMVFLAIGMASIVCALAVTAIALKALLDSILWGKRIGS